MEVELAVTPTQFAASLLVSSADFWLLTLSRLVIFLLAGVFAALSFLAYRREGKRSLLGAVIGFLFVCAGFVFEWTYEFGVKGDLFFSRTELAHVQTVEGVLLFVGFGLLLFSVYRS